jgi:hypothetical protein
VLRFLNAGAAKIVVGTNDECPFKSILNSNFAGIETARNASSLVLTVRLRGRQKVADPDIP